VALLQTRLHKLMAEGRPDDYPFTVSTTWQLSFQRLEIERPAAAALLRLCAFLSPDDMPISVLVAGRGELPEGLQAALSDDVELDGTIAALRRYSLVDRQGDSLRLHQIVQAVVRESLGVEQRRMQLGQALRVLRLVFPDEPQNDSAQWSLCDRLLPHVRAVEQLAGDQVDDTSALSWLLNRAAMYLQARAELGQASLMLERALAVRGGKPGLEDLDVAQSLNSLGFELRIQGDMSTGRHLVERALAIRERLLGRQHPATAASLSLLANLIRDHERPAELPTARALMERALEIRERALGPDHPDTGQSLSGLAEIRRDQGELDAARCLAERAMDIRERAFGSDDARTANTLRILGTIVAEQGDLVTARTMLERSHTVWLGAPGANGATKAYSAVYLADVRRRLGEQSAARSLAENALATLSRTLGSEHFWTVAAARVLAEITSEVGDQSGPGRTRPIS
jgi:tetratricopeptide (TPR) repeat protein